MQFKSFDELNEIHIDVLREIGNIGSGNAASALSQMLGQPVDIAIPQIDITGYNEAYRKLGGAESIMVGILLMFSGSLNGMIMFLLPPDIACNLINSLMYTEIKSHAEIDEIGFSAIGELANVMSASFVRAITDMTGLFIDISPPSSTVDMLASIMSVPLIYFANMGDKIMLIKNDLVLGNQKTHANIMLLPDAESLVKLMTSLGIEL